MAEIILASASPRRKELLEKAGVVFTVMTGNCEEKITSDVPGQVVEELSRSKAFSVAGMLAEAEKDTIVIGADTIVAYGKRILGKPRDTQDAVDTLRQLSGNTHQVYTGVTVLRYTGDGWEAHTFSERTDVSFYPVTEEEIRSYAAGGEPMDKAGSYAIQGGFGIYVKGICGDYNNVVGLPVARLLHETKKLGIELRG